MLRQMWCLQDLLAACSRVVATAMLGRPWYAWTSPKQPAEGLSAFSPWPWWTVIASPWGRHSVFVNHDGIYATNRHVQVIDGLFNMTS